MSIEAIKPLCGKDIATLKHVEIVTEVSRLISEVDRLQRENAALADHNGKLEQAIKNMTGNKIGFTYEPTGERVNLYSGSPNAFEILAKHPEILQLVVGVRAEIERRTPLASTGGQHHGN